MLAWQEMQGSLEAARDQISELGKQVTALKIELDYERGRVADVLGDTDEGLSVSQRLLSLSDEQQHLIRVCNDKKLQVQQVLEFFGQDKVASVVKASPKLHDPSEQAAGNPAS